MKTISQYFRKNRLYLMLLMGWFLTAPIQADVISTVAGNGTKGYSGDGGAATSAQLNFPFAVAIDNNSNLYIADHRNHRIRKMTKDGVISTVAGTGTAGYSGDDVMAIDTQLYHPVRVAVDNSGNLYIAEYYNHRIRKVSKNGMISTVAGNGTQGYSGDGGLAAKAQLNYPAGITTDSSGNLYIADAMNYRIRKVTTDGMINTVVGTGTAGYSGDGDAATSAQLNYPYGITIEPNNGNLYIADAMNFRIRKVTTDGVISTVANTGTQAYSNNGMPTVTQFNYPTDVAVDNSGNLYIAYYANHYIRKMTPDGVISTIAGTGTAGYSGDGEDATSAKLNEPISVAIDSSGNLYIADTINHRVRQIVITNKPPVLDASANPVFTAINEDDFTNSGTSVYDLIDSVSDVPLNMITDADYDALEGIAVITVDNTNGSWEFFTDSTWTAFGSVSETTARLLASTNLIRFVPNADFNGSVNLNFRAWDQSSGNPGETANVSNNGGITAFSAEIETASITVNPVNDAPTFTSTAIISIDEDALYSYNITTNDIDAGDSLTITAKDLPAWLNLTDNGKGTATLSGTPTDDEVEPHDIILHVNDGTKDVDQSFTITVNDTGINQILMTTATIIMVPIGIILLMLVLQPGRGRTCVFALDEIIYLTIYTSL